MDAPAPATTLSHRQILIVFSGLILGMLLAALDQTIVATALPTIVGDLGGLDHLSWVVTAYLLTSTASTPLYGKISDMLGRKLLFQAAIVIFLTGSVLAGLSRNMTQLIAFRGVQGLGAGGLMALAMAIIGDIVSPRERGRYQGYLGSVFALASVGGPLLGGFFVDHLSWRWVFYINLPVGIVAMFVTGAVLRLPFRKTEHRIDYPGAALLVAAVSCLLLVTVWGGSTYPWSSPQIASLAVAGIALTVAFLVQERRAAEPILPLPLFKDPIFSISTASMFILGLAMFGAIIFVPLFLQVVGGASATRSGLLLTPLMLGVIAASVAAGRTISAIGRYKIFPVAGTAIMATGLYLLSRMDAHTTRTAAWLSMTIVGIGIGLVMQVLVLAVQNSVDARHMGVATSATSFFRSMGGAFGVAVFGAVFTNRMQYHLPRLLGPLGSSAPGDLASSLNSAPERLAALPPAVHAAVVEAFARSLHAVFLWSVPLAVGGFVLSLFLREQPLRETTHVGAPLTDELAPPAVQRAATLRNPS